MKINLRNLDCLRGLLAVYVLAGHSRWLLWAGQASWLNNTHSTLDNILAYSSALLRYGHEAVIVFFVLSGFFIHLRAAQQFASQETVEFNVRQYFRRRSHRLIPPYLLALLVTFVADQAGHYLWPTLYEARTTDAFLNLNFSNKGYSWRSIIPAAVFLPNSLGTDFGTNGPLWSLSYEVVYYLLYPLWIYLRIKIGVKAYFLILILTPIAFWLGGISYFIGTASHYYLWIAGAGLAELVAANRLPQYLGAITLMLLLSSIIGLLLTNHQVLVPIINLGLGVGLVLGFGCYFDYWIKGRLYNALEAFGIRSYTIYISHFPLLVLLAAGIFQNWEARPTTGWLALGGGLLVLIITCGLFNICEKHFLHSRLKMPFTYLK